MSDLLEVQNLHIRFRGRDKHLDAVKGVSFKVATGKTVAVVGESGSGKSVTALALTRLLPRAPACEIQGTVLLDGQDILKMPPNKLREVRGKDIAYIFQEPATSLNPVFTIGYQIKEAVDLHVPAESDPKGHIIESLNAVGIRNAPRRYHSYPHELSGGMQQRAMIAMALSCNPRFLVADEPTTALDVTIQKQIMDLLKDIREKRNMSILLITHNFGIIKGFADEVIVMYRGDIVESGSTENILENPQHPYTQALIHCIPHLGQKVHRLTTIDHEKIAASLEV